MISRLGMAGAVVAAAGVALFAASAQARPGDLIVGDTGASKILRVDPGTGAVSTISSSPLFGEPDQAVFGPDGQLYVSDENIPEVVRVNPRTGAAFVLASGSPLGTNFGIDVMPSGNLLVTDLDLPGLIEINRKTGAQRIVSQGGSLMNPGSGVEATPSGKVYATDVSTDAVVGVNLRTGAQSILNSDPLISGPEDLEPAPDGSLILGVFQSLFRFQPTTNTVTHIADTPAGAGGYGVALAPNGAIYTTDDGPTHRILRLAPGASTFTTTAAAGIGRPIGVTIEPPRCGGRMATIVGSTGPDKLKGSLFPDVIAGLGGKDKIKGLGGRDVLCGGRGADRLAGGKGHDRLLGGPGHDSQRQ